MINILNKIQSVMMSLRFFKRHPRIHLHQQVVQSITLAEPFPISNTNNIKRQDAGIENNRKHFSAVQKIMPQGLATKKCTANNI